MRRVKRKAFAAALAALLGLASPGPAFAETGPPLKGAFEDAMTLFEEPMEAPDDAFTTSGGQEMTLADFRGHVVVLNFWATWCAPCVEEMPSLDRLQARLGSEGLTVVALSGDRGGMTAVEPFFERLELTHLEIFLDPKNLLSRRLGIRALPTTLVIDRQGRIVAGLQGATAWDAPEAIEFFRYYLGDAPQRSGLLKTGG